jgi:hypothetical protein
MFLQHMMGILYHPKDEWGMIRKEHYSTFHVFLAQISILAAIPAVSLFIGTTQIGWSIAGSEYVRLETMSALMAGVAFYFAMWFAVGVIAYAVHWMEKTYGADASFDRCMVLTTFTSTPLFMAGFAGLWPMLWFVVMVGLAALCYTIYLLYNGVETIMEIPEEQAFLFGTSILTVGLVVLVGMITGSVLLWGLGMMPVFTS